MRLLPFADPAVGEGAKTAPQVLELIHECLRLGITTFDLAPVYGLYEVEKLFGQALALEPGIRDKMELVSKANIQFPCSNRPDVKIHHYDTSEEHLIWSAETTLKHLGTDRLDLLLIHRADPLMDVNEVVAAFKRLYAEKKVRSFGVSNFNTHQVELLATRLAKHNIPFVAHQLEHSAVNIDALHNGILDQCQTLNLRPMAWSPLGGGSLFEEGDGRSDKILRLQSALDHVAAELGATREQAGLAFVLRHPSNIVAVLGSNKIERIASSAQATKLALSREQYTRILVASQGHDIP